MQSSTPKKHKVHLRPEMFIISVIILCLTFILGNSNANRYSGFTINENGIISLINGQDEIRLCKDQQKPVFEYTLLTCQYIEIWDSNLELVDQLRFGNNTINSDLSGVEDRSYIESNTIINGMNITIYSIWVEYGSRRYLIRYAINNSKAFEMMVSTIIAYIVLVMCYILLLITVYYQIKGVSNKYKKSVRDLYVNTI